MEGMKKATREEDREITVTLKMSEANFIISALAGVKFRADSLIQNIVDQGNPQLPKPRRSDEQQSEAEVKVNAVGLSEEVDEAICALFSDEFNADPNSLEFDFSKPGHVIVGHKYAAGKAEATIAKAQKFVTGLNLVLNVNTEIPGVTVFVFSWAKDTAPAGSEAMRVVKDEPAAETAETAKEENPNGNGRKRK